MWNFEDNLSARDIISRHTGSQKGVYLFYNPPINFHIAIKPLVNMVKEPVVWWRMHVIDLSKQVHLIGLTNFISTVIGPKHDKLSCEINSRNAP